MTTLHLVRRDLVAAWPVLPLILLWELLNAPVRFFTGGGYLVGSVFLTVFLATGSSWVEWRHGTQSFFGSLPVSRRQLVVGRYATSGLALLLGLTLCFGLAGLGDRLIVAQDSRAGELMTVDGLAAYALLVMGLVALFHPLQIGLGMSRGWLIFGLAIVMVMSVLIGFGGETGVDPQVGPPAERALRPLLLGGEQRLIQGLRAIRTDHGWGMWLGVVAGLPVLAIMASAVLSMRLYSRRDL